MNPVDFRRHGHGLVEWIADYLAGSERYPVLPRVAPGDVRRALPAEAPEYSEPFEVIFADFEQILVPALTHWNHRCGAPHRPPQNLKRCRSAGCAA